MILLLGFSVGFTGVSIADDTYYYCISTLLNGTEKNHSRFQKSDFSHNLSKKRWEDLSHETPRFIYEHGRFEEFIRFGNRQGRCDEQAEQLNFEELKKLEKLYGK